MTEFWAVISLILGFAIRIGIPVSLTIIIGKALKKLDNKWQEDGRKIMIKDLDLSERIIQDLNCWEFYECSEVKRKNCSMEGHAEEPCWQLCEAVGGNPAECLSCKYKELVEQNIPSTIKLISSN